MPSKTQPIQIPKNQLLTFTRNLDNEFINVSAFKRWQHAEYYQNANEAIVQTYANTLTYIAVELFNHLQIHDLWNVKSFDSTEETSASKVMDLHSAHYHYLEKIILSEANVSKRRVLLERWIAIATKLTQEGNFFSASAVTAGLINNNLLRLIKSEKENFLSSLAHKQLNELISIYGNTVENNEKFNLILQKHVGPRLSHIEFAKYKLIKLNAYIDENKSEGARIQNEISIRRERCEKILIRVSKIEKKLIHEACKNPQTLKLKMDKLYKIYGLLNRNINKFEQKLDKLNTLYFQAVLDHQREIKTEFSRRNSYHPDWVNPELISRDLMTDLLSPTVVTRVSLGKIQADLRLKLTSSESKLAMTGEKGEKEKVETLRLSLKNLDPQIKEYSNTMYHRSRFLRREGKPRPGLDIRRFTVGEVFGSVSEMIAFTFFLDNRTEKKPSAYSVQDLIRANSCPDMKEALKKESLQSSLPKENVDLKLSINVADGNKVTLQKQPSYLDNVGLFALSAQELQGKEELRRSSNRFRGK